MRNTRNNRTVHDRTQSIYLATNSSMSRPGRRRSVLRRVLAMPAADAIVMQMVQECKVGLNEPIGTYLPDLAKSEGIDASSVRRSAAEAPPGDTEGRSTGARSTVPSDPTAPPSPSP